MEIYVDKAGLHVHGRIIPLGEHCDGDCRGPVTHVGEFKLLTATDTEITGCMLLCDVCVTQVDDPGVTVTSIKSMFRQASDHEHKIKAVTIERLNLLREWVRSQGRVTISQAASFLDVHLSTASVLLFRLYRDGFLQRRMVGGRAEYTAC